MKLLILGINFTPEIISTAVYTTGLAEAMVRRNADVEVVTAQPYFPGWKVFSGHPRFGWTRRKLASGVKVVHCPHYVPAKPTGARRILHHASFALSALPVLIWKGLRFRPDLVLIIAPALLAAPFGWITARACGAKAWLHIQDFEVEAAMATGLLRERGLAGRLAKRFDRWIHHRFDRVSTISDPMLAKLKAKGIPEDRIFDLRNWADLSAIRPMPEGSSPYHASFGIPTRHVALYSGNIANKQGLEILPQVAQRLAHRDDLTFVVCGEGSFLKGLRRLAEGTSNIVVHPLQPVERLGDLMGLATLHLLPQIAGVADLVLPSKLTNMLASGRPVVATAEASTSLAKAVKGCGEATAPGDAAAMAEAIERLLENADLRASQGQAARQRALDQLDSGRILQAFHAEALQLTGAFPAEVKTSHRRIIQH